MNKINKSFIKQYLLYILRWECSSPILAVCLSLLKLGTLWNTIIANLIGGIIFFWIDKLIFKEKNNERTKENIKGS